MEKKHEKERKIAEKEKANPGKKVKRTSTPKKSIASGKRLAKQNVNFPGGHNLTGNKLIYKLGHHNAIEEQAAQPEFGEAPVIQEKNIDKALLAIVNAIPSKIDMHSANADKKQLRQAAKNFGYRNITAHNGEWLLKGMNSPLRSHQLLAADWMLNREFSSTHPHGGILADTMGLGKTVEILAVLVANRSRSQKPKATLIVVPSSILNQWLLEIKKHVKDDIFPSICTYKSSKAGAFSQAMIEGADIVLTTYNEVIKSWPYLSITQMRKLSPETFLKYEKEKSSLKKGMLHKIK